MQTLEAIAVLIKLLNTLVYRLLERLYKDRFPHKKSSLSIIQVYYLSALFYGHRHLENITCVDDVIYDVMTSTISVLFFYIT